MLRIKADRMKDLEKFGFEINKMFIYPKCYTRVHKDFFIRINFGEKLINMFDLKDKNAIGEIWLLKHKFSFASNEIVEPYIQDLIKADMVEEVTE